MTNQELQKLIEERTKLVNEFSSLCHLIHGSVVERYMCCSRPNCNTTEEIPLDPNYAARIIMELGLQQPYNVANDTGIAGGYSSAGTYERRGQASEPQRQAVRRILETSPKRALVERYMKENLITLDTLTNAQANDIIQMSKRANSQPRYAPNYPPTYEPTCDPLDI